MTEKNGELYCKKQVEKRRQERNDQRNRAEGHPKSIRENFKEELVPITL